MEKVGEREKEVGEMKQSMNDIHLNMLQKRYKLSEYDIGLYYGYFRGERDLGEKPSDGKYMIAFEKFIKKQL